MDTKPYLLQSFYRYNSEVMPTLPIEKQAEIISTTPSDKTLLHISRPLAKKVLEKGFFINNEEEFKSLFSKYNNYFIKEGTYFVALLQIYQDNKENFLKLDKETVTKKYLTTEYIKDTLIKTLFVFNDDINKWDYVLKNGKASYYAFLQDRISNFFKDREKIHIIYNAFKENEHILSYIKNVCILGFFISSYLRVLELGYEAGYISRADYGKLIFQTIEKIKWIFLSWDEYLISIMFGAYLADKIGLYNDFLPVNRLVYNIKAILFYNVELLENQKLWNNIDKSFLIKYADSILSKYEITKTTYIEFLSYKDSYINDVLKVAHMQFYDVFIPLCEKYNLTPYFINDNKNSFLHIPLNPFVDEIDKENMFFLSFFQPGEFPIVYDGLSLITNFGVWTKKNYIIKDDTIFLPHNKIDKIKILLKNDLSFQIKMGRYSLLHLTPIPEQFNLSVEEFYLSSKKDIKKLLDGELPRFQNFLKDLFRILN